MCQAPEPGQVARLEESAGAAESGVECRHHLHLTEAAVRVVQAAERSLHHLHLEAPGAECRWSLNLSSTNPQEELPAASTPVARHRA